MGSALKPMRLKVPLPALLLVLLATLLEEAEEETEDDALETTDDELLEEREDELTLDEAADVAEELLTLLVAELALLDKLTELLELLLTNAAAVVACESTSAAPPPQADISPPSVSTAPIRNHNANINFSNSDITSIYCAAGIRKFLFRITLWRQRY
ncbi:MAG: hypothetical protein QM808_13360 [Steroidobacteraceae bacterium]